MDLSGSKTVEIAKMEDLVSVHTDGLREFLFEPVAEAGKHEVLRLRSRSLRERRSSLRMTWDS